MASKASASAEYARSTFVAVAESANCTGSSQIASRDNAQRTIRPCAMTRSLWSSNTSAGVILSPSKIFLDERKSGMARPIRWPAKLADFRENVEGYDKRPGALGHRDQKVEDSIYFILFLAT